MKMHKIQPKQQTNSVGYLWMWQSFGFNIRKLSQMKANLKINWQAFRQKFYVAFCVCTMQTIFFGFLVTWILYQNISIHTIVYINHKIHTLHLYLPLFPSLVPYMHKISTAMLNVCRTYPPFQEMLISLPSNIVFDFEN